MKTYLIDIYRDGSQWPGFSEAGSLDEARKYILSRFPGAEQFGAPSDPYHQQEAQERGALAKCIENWGIDSTDYADIYEVIGAGLKIGSRVQSGEGEDHDTGRIDDIDGDTATVSWDSLVVTPCPLELLRPASLPSATRPSMFPASHCNPT
jgi:hypothetical protein